MAHNKLHQAQSRLLSTPFCQHLNTVPVQYHLSGQLYIPMSRRGFVCVSASCFGCFCEEAGLGVGRARFFLIDAARFRVTQARGDETALKEEGGCEGITAIAGEDDLKQHGIETWP